MTEQGTNLPEEILNRVAERKKKIYDSEMSSLGEHAASEAEALIADHRRKIEDLISARRRKAAETREREMNELREFEKETLEALEKELIERRNQRLAIQDESRTKRLRGGKTPPTAQGVAAAGQTVPAETAAQDSPAEDPARKIPSILKKAQKFLDQGETALAAKIVAEGLEIDSFNPELINLDAQIQERLSSETFGTPAATPAAEQKEEKPKAPRKKATDEPSSSPGKTSGIPARVFVIAAVIVLAGLAVIVGRKYMPKSLEARSTIAILPWNVAQDEDTVSVLASSLPEETARLLSRLHSSIHLGGYTTTSHLASMPGNTVRSLAAIGYSHFLRGSIEREGPLFTVRVALQDSVGSDLWSGEYTRTLDSVMLVPSTIVGEISGLLEGSPGPAAGMSGTDNPDAFFQYLRGLRALRATGDSGIDRAIDAFSEAVSADPSFAGAHAGLATSLVMKHTTGPSIPDARLENARRSADEAIRRDPSTADGYLALSRVMIEEGDFDGAMTALDSAAGRSPGESAIPYLRGMIHVRTGSGDPARESLYEAYLLDPRNPDILRLCALVNLLNDSLGRAMWYDETAMFFSGDTTAYVIGSLADIIMLDPTLSLTHGERVVSACLKKLDENPEDYFALYRLARFLQYSGKIEESNSYFNGLGNILRRGLADRPNDTRMRLYLALTQNRLGQYDDAVARAEAAVSEDPGNAEAKYLLAQIYAIQMFSSKTKTVDEEKRSRCISVLREALSQRFIVEELMNADLYNLYSRTDAWALFRGEETEVQ